MLCLPQPNSGGYLLPPSPLCCLALVSQSYFVQERIDALSLDYQMMQDPQEQGVGQGSLQFLLCH